MIRPLTPPLGGRTPSHPAPPFGGRLKEEVMRALPILLVAAVTVFPATAATTKMQTQLTGAAEVPGQRRAEFLVVVLRKDEDGRMLSEGGSGLSHGGRRQVIRAGRRYLAPLPAIQVAALPPAPPIGSRPWLLKSPLANHVD